MLTGGHSRPLASPLAARNASRGSPPPGGGAKRSVPLDRSGCPARLHGTAWRYNHERCRCPDAIQAFKRYRLQKQRGTYQSRRMPAIGSRRRVQALAAQGWSLAAQSAHSGISRSMLYELVAERRQRINKETVDKINKMYDDLSMKLPPETGGDVTAGVTRTKLWAISKGWRPPLAWDDDQLDKPDTKPHRPNYRTLTPGKLIRIRETMHLSNRKAAAQIGVSEGTVRRARKLLSGQNPDISAPTGTPLETPSASIDQHCA